MTIDDAACVSFRAQRLVIPSAATCHSERSEESKRVAQAHRSARSDHAGWSQGIGMRGARREARGEGRGARGARGEARGARDEARGDTNDD
ncbi:MAG: hypothetical protein KatS3mg058_1148 [Roseiflexus sp.]|nr:MAG: hypothetical protein KatS3mg058_1148 [Roseiflexus sp.]